MAAWAIETEALTRRFGARTAVDQINLRVPLAGVYGFLGPNGAGKTTTIRMLLGLIRPNLGTIRLLGQSLAQERSAILCRVGALVEMPSLYPHLSARENLEITRRLLDLPKTSILRVLEVVGLEADADRLVREYSLGMRQRMGLALAMLASPALLILDEPTNGLDPAGILEIRELIKAMPRQSGVTVFLSSHLLSEVELVADQVGIIHKGQMLFQGAVAQLQANRKGWITVGVSDTRQAARVLRASGWKLPEDDDPMLRVDASGELAAAQINSVLTGAGISVHHLSEHRPSLEDLFLQLTKGAEGG